MKHASKNKKSNWLFGRLGLFLLLALTLFMPQNRVWAFSANPVPEVGKILAASSMFIGENCDEIQYDASGCTVAPKTTTFRHYGFADDAARFEDGLRPGAYATHARGRPMSGTTAQQKLALPHDPAPNAYYKVRVGSNVKVNGPGPVQPTQAPIRPGGGIEYTFPNGTPPGSVTGPFQIR